VVKSMTHCVKQWDFFFDEKRDFEEKESKRRWKGVMEPVSSVSRKNI